MPAGGSEGDGGDRRNEDAMTIEWLIGDYLYIKEKKNYHRAIQREFEPVGPTMLKNLIGVGWGLLPTLRWVGSLYIQILYLVKQARSCSKVKLT